MTHKHIPGRLPILVSSRIRLTDSEREKLRTAYSNAKANESNEGYRSVIDYEIGMSSLVFNDLINSRQSISAPVVLSLQNVLGVDILNKERLIQACNNYVDYIIASTENTQEPLINY